MVSVGFYRLVLWVIKLVRIRSCALGKQNSWDGDTDGVVGNCERK